MGSIYSSKWAFSDTSTFNGSSVRFPFAAGDSLKKVQRWVRSRNLTGDRISRGSQHRKDSATYQGSLPCDPSPKFFGWAFPRAMGGGSETAPAFANEPTTFYMTPDRDSALNGDCYKYGPCVISNLEVQCRGALTSCTIEIMALGGTAGVSFAGAAVGTTAAWTPYHYADWGVEVGAETFDVLDFTLRLDNAVRYRYNTGSTDPQAFIYGDRTLTISGRASLDQDIYATMADAATAVTGTLTGTNGTVSTAFSFLSMLIDAEHIQQGDGEFIFPFMASVVGETSAEMTIANDVTP